MNNHNTQKLADTLAAVQSINHICGLNGFPVMGILVYENETIYTRYQYGREPIEGVGPKGWPFNVCAYYRSNTCYINLERCASRCSEGQVRNHNYPRHRIDRSPFGVIHHELGHHFDIHLSLRHGFEVGAYKGGWAKAAFQVGERGITTYADTNPWEWFAEMFRLYSTNPTLLSEIRPKTFEILNKWVKLPYISVPTMPSHLSKERP